MASPMSLSPWNKFMHPAPKAAKSKHVELEYDGVMNLVYDCFEKKTKVRLLFARVCVGSLCRWCVFVYGCCCCYYSDDYYAFGVVATARVAAAADDVDLLLPLVYEQASSDTNENMPEFMRSFLLHKFGLPSISDGYLYSICKAIRKHSERSYRLALFGRMVGVLDAER